MEAVAPPTISHTVHVIRPIIVCGVQIAALTRVMRDLTATVLPPALGRRSHCEGRFEFAGALSKPSGSGS